MAKGKGVGAAPIIAIAIVSTLVTILLDKTGITVKVQNIVERIVK